jgi:hypothetical protein
MSRRILIDDDAAQYANLEERLKRIESTLARLVGTDTYKTALPFGANWGNYGVYEGATYSRIGRMVILQGLVSKTGTPAGGDVIATLPAGYRPAEHVIFATATGETTVGGRVDVESTGQIIWRTGATGETDYTSLSGIAFVID